MLNDESVEKYGLKDYDGMAKQIKKYDLITGGSMKLMRWISFLAENVHIASRIYS